MAWEKTFIHSGVYMTTKTRKADKAAAFLQIAKFSLNAKAFIKQSGDTFKLCIAIQDFARFTGYLSGVTCSI